MPTHIVSLLKCSKSLQHFFVPLIYNDSDERWDSSSFWNIPCNLPSTLKSFRGFDAQTPLKFVHECIRNLPNIEEFHVVLYFGSAHPDFIACGYTNDTLKHLAQNCKYLKSFEGYFHSTNNLLNGIELMIENCCILKLIGLLFHPDVNDIDIDNLIKSIKESIICKKYNPSFSRLTENPNQHVTLRVVEITFNHSLSIQTTPNHITHDQNDDDNDNDHDDDDQIDESSGNELYGTGDNNIISSQHLKSLDEIEISDDDSNQSKN